MMSLIRRVSRSLPRRAVATIFPAIGDRSPVSPSLSNSSAPRIEVSGVRSSWLTAETNSLFIRVIAKRSVVSRKHHPGRGVPGLVAEQP